MKKLTFVLLATLTFMFVACNPQEKPKQINFKLMINNEGSVKEVKNGDVITIKQQKGDEGFEGELITDKKFKLIVDVTRNVTKGTRDELCVGTCMLGQIEEEVGGTTVLKDVNKFEFSVLELKLQAYAHCTPASAGTNEIQYTFYPKDEPTNKISFKVIHIKKP